MTKIQIDLDEEEDRIVEIYKLVNKLTTKQDCLKLTNNIRNFYPNYLCSNPALNTSCIKQFTTGCIDGISEVFWMDSCGNRENIYDANKDRSWNSGLILQKNESCNSNSANISQLGFPYM